MINRWIGTFQAGFRDARDLPPWFMAQTNQAGNAPCISFSFSKFHWLEADPKESFGPICFCGCPLCGRANSNNPNQHGGVSQRPHGPIISRILDLQSLNPCGLWMVSSSPKVASSNADLRNTSSNLAIYWATCRKVVYKYI